MCVYRAVNSRAGASILYVDTNSRKLSDPSPLSTLTNRNLNTFTFSDTTTFQDSVIITIQVPAGNGTSGDNLVLYVTDTVCYGTVPGRVDAYTLQRGQRGLRRINERIQRFTIDIPITAIIEYDNTPVSIKTLESVTSVHPIPATNEIFIGLPGNLNGQTNWEILSMTGQVIRSGKHAGEHTFIINSEGLQGVYTLRLSSYAGPITKRVVFQN